MWKKYLLQQVTYQSHPMSYLQLLLCESLALLVYLCLLVPTVQPHPSTSLITSNYNMENGNVGKLITFIITVFSSKGLFLACNVYASIRQHRQQVISNLSTNSKCCDKF